MKQLNPDQQAKKTLAQLARQTRLSVEAAEFAALRPGSVSASSTATTTVPNCSGRTDRFIWLAYKPNGTDRVRLFSANFPNDGIVDFQLGVVPGPKSAIADTWRGSRTAWISSSAAKDSR